MPQGQIDSSIYPDELSIGRGVIEKLVYSPLGSTDELKDINPDGVYISVDALFLPEENYWASPFYEKLGFISIDPPRFDTIRMYRKVHM